MRALLVTLTTCLLVLPAQAKYSGGTGEPNDPYQIATAADLIALGEGPADYDKHFVLVADIDLDPNLPGRKVFDKAVIAPRPPSERGVPFTGVFDGNGFTISHLTIRGRSYLGLFGQVASCAKITNLGLVGVRIVGSGTDVGGLAGLNWGIVSQCYSGGVVSGTDCVAGLLGDNGGSATQCHSTAVVSGDFFVAGGLAGLNSGTIAESFASGPVRGGGQVGGLVGLNYRGSIVTSYSTGSVSGNTENDAIGTTDEIGGLVGYNEGSITKSYATGAVCGERSVGGLVGSNGHWTYAARIGGWGVVTDCYSTGAIRGTSGVGGLVGSNGCGNVTHCYSAGSVSGESTVGGLVGGNGASVSECFWDTQTSGQSKSDGGTGKTTPEMQTAETFLEAGWDFVGETGNGTEDIWCIFDGRYYPLLWELAPLHVWSPYPKDGAIDIDLRAVLAWIPGRSRSLYDVYFGQDATPIEVATIENPGLYRGRQGTTIYDPGGLEWGETYYWRLDEINETDPNSPWKSTVWSFSTIDFVVVAVVDDFESYTDDEGKKARIYETWIDGVYIDANSPGNGTGSSVGNWEAPFAEQEIVHAGKQAMPIDYDNANEPWYSEAERTWETPQDWTIEGADTLTLYFEGQSNNRPDPLYVGIEDNTGRMVVVVHPDAGAVLATEWQKWHVALGEVRAAGVDVATVQKMVIGVGDRTDPSTPLGAGPKPGGAGRIYIDDIRLTKRLL